MSELGVVLAFSALSTVAVGLRLYARFALIRTTGLDDLLITISLMAQWVFSAMAVLEWRYGMGQPAASLSDAELENQLKALWLSVPFHSLSLVLTKLSILALYLRIFPQRWLQIVCRLLMAFLVLYGLWAVGSAFIFCVPVDTFWKAGAQQHCLSRKFVWYFNSSVNIMTDFIILGLPMPVLTTIKLPQKQKLAVIIIFGIGIFGCVTSFIRLKALEKVANSTDISHYNGSAALWSSLELNAAILCSCLPALRPLVAHFFPFLLLSNTSMSSSELNNMKGVTWCISPSARHNSAIYTTTEITVV